MSISESFGQIQFEAPSTRVLNAPSGGAVSCILKPTKWTPPERYAKHLPPGFTIGLDCYEGADGDRRFLPERGDWRCLATKCFLAGMAIRTQLGKLPEESRNNVRNQFIASQWMKHRHDYLKRGFSHSRDVFVRQSSREDPSLRNTMSEIVELHPSLKQIGLVRELGRDDIPDPNRRFFDGLYQIAQTINSESLSDIDTETILRNSLLLHRSPLPELSETQLEEVNQRLYQQVNQKHDWASDEFVKWLNSSKTNLPTLISRMPDGPPPTRIQVKAGLFELAWLGLKETTTNIHATMTTIRCAVHDLNSVETRIFDSLYARQPDLGHFPILLLLDRHKFLMPAVVDIWNGSNPGDVLPAIRTLLYFYGSMARHRRRADRIGKERRESRNQDGRISSQVSLNEQTTGSWVKNDVPETIIDGLKLHCHKCDSQSLTLDYDICEPELVVSICGECNQCGSELLQREVAFPQLADLLKKTITSGAPE